MTMYTHKHDILPLQVQSVKFILTWKYTNVFNIMFD